MESKLPMYAADICTVSIWYLWYHVYLVIVYIQIVAKQCQSKSTKTKFDTPTIKVDSRTYLTHSLKSFSDSLSLSVCGQVSLAQPNTRVHPIEKTLLLSKLIFAQELKQAKMYLQNLSDELVSDLVLLNSLPSEDEVKEFCKMSSQGPKQQNFYCPN